MDNDNLKKICEFITKRRSIDEVCSEFNLNKLEVMYMIRELEKNGYNIVKENTDNGIYFTNLYDSNKDYSLAYSINTPNFNDFKVMVISDTRLGSIYEQPSILNDAYRLAYQRGINYVFHCGDISEGLYSPSSPYFSSVQINDTYMQADYIAKKYPQVEGITTLFITGEHDETHLKKNHINIGRLISSQRNDMVYLGHANATIDINNSKTMIRHPKQMLAYTVSYKVQQYINSMRSEDRVDVLLNGHGLQADRMIYRSTESFQIPSIVATTPQMADKNNANTVGIWILDYKFDNKGFLEDIVWEFIPYYITKDQDYLKARKLVISKEK